MSRLIATSESAIAAYALLWQTADGEASRTRGAGFPACQRRHSASLAPTPIGRLESLPHDLRDRIQQRLHPPFQIPRELHHRVIPAAGFGHFQRLAELDIHPPVALDAGQHGVEHVLLELVDRL